MPKLGDFKKSSPILWVFFLILLALSIFNVFPALTHALASTQDVVPFSFGAGDSMQPTIGNKAFMLIDRGFPFEDLQEGDVVAIRFPDNGIAHRISTKTILQSTGETVYFTKGDNNKTFETMKEENYIGKIFWWVTLAQ